VLQINLRKIMIFSIFGILLIILFFNLFGRNGDWSCDYRTGKWIKHGNPWIPEPQKVCKRIGR